MYKWIKHEILATNPPLQSLGKKGFVGNNSNCECANVDFLGLQRKYNKTMWPWITFLKRRIAKKMSCHRVQSKASDLHDIHLLLRWGGSCFWQDHWLSAKKRWQQQVRYWLERMPLCDDALQWAWNVTAIMVCSPWVALQQWLPQM